MTRRLLIAAATFTSCMLALTAQPAAAHEGTATVDCDRAMFGAIGFGPGEHIVGAVLTVTAGTDVPVLVDLEPQTLDGDSGTLTWDVAEHTDRPGLLELVLAVSWDAHGGGTTSATAALVCSEPATTTTVASTTTTTGVPVTAATTAVPTTTTVVDVPPVADDAGPPELPRTGGTLVPLTVGALVVAVGALGLTLGRRGRT